MSVKIESGWKAGDIQEMYSDNGTKMSASSSVVVRDQAMLVGTILTDAYYCTLKSD